MNVTADPNIPSAFRGYIELNGNDELLNALNESYSILESEEMNLFKNLGSKVYAPGKWTIYDILQHLIDTERIMTYRAVCFARKDSTPLPGFEENDYAAASNANQRSFENLLNELKLIRKSSILLFESFTDDMLLSTGIANGNKISVLSLGLVVSGHQKHHFKIIRERYLPLL